MVEKLDGIRGYWDGNKMYSKAGNLIEIPDWFAQALPSQFHLDGEFWYELHNFNNEKGVED